MLLFIFFSGSFWTKGGSATENSLRSRLTALDIHRKQLLVFFLFPADGRGFSGRSGQIAQRLKGQLSLFEFGAFAAVERSVALLAPLFERRIAQDRIGDQQSPGEGVHPGDVGDEKVFRVG